MSILEKNGDSDSDQIKKSNFFLEFFSDFERDYENLKLSGCPHGRMGSLGQDPGAVFAGANRNPLNKEKRVDLVDRDQTRMCRK